MAEREGQFYFIPVENGEIVNKKGGYYFSVGGIDLERKAELYETPEFIELRKKYAENLFRRVLSPHSREHTFRLPEVQVQEKGRGRFAATVGLLALGVGVLAGIGAAGTGTSPDNVVIATLGTAALVFASGYGIDLFSREKNFEERLRKGS